MLNIPRISIGPKDIGYLKFFGNFIWQGGIFLVLQICGFIKNPFRFFSKGHVEMDELRPYK